MCQTPQTETGETVLGFRRVPGDERQGAWRDLDDGTGINVQVVTEAPNRLPAKQFHIVILQGELGTSRLDFVSFYSFSCILPFQSGAVSAGLLSE